LLIITLVILTYLIIDWFNNFHTRIADIITKHNIKPNPVKESGGLDDILDGFELQKVSPASSGSRLLGPALITDRPESSCCQSGKVSGTKLVYKIE
jgi:hypothetical protein